jgi:virulence-associated protein VagC
VSEERRVRLFRNGRNPLRIPREWELDADEAILRSEDGVLTIRPLPREGLCRGWRRSGHWTSRCPRSVTTTSGRSTSPSADVGRYLLDTDTLSWLVREPAGAVARRVAAAGEGDDAHRGW